MPDACAFPARTGGTGERKQRENPRIARLETPRGTLDESECGSGRNRTTPEKPQKTHILETRGAESGAVYHPDGDLARVVNAWPTLPEPIRRAVMAMVEAGSKGGGR